MESTNSKNNVGVSIIFVLNTTFETCTPSEFNISHLNSVSKLAFRANTTVSAASRTVSNCTTAPTLVFGIGNNFTVSSVITPKVPSAPKNRAFNSYPVELFLTFRLVSMHSPFGVTTFMLTIFSFDVPYLSVDNPLPPVLAIPPTLGFEDGSGPNINPYGSKNVFNSFFNTPAPTVAVRCISSIDIVFKSDTSKTTPPKYATHPPSNPVPAPLGTTGFLNSAHTRTIFSTSRVVFTCTTASIRSPPPLSPCILPISLLHDSKTSRSPFVFVCTLLLSSSSSSSSVSASRNRSRKNSFSSNSSFLDDDDDVTLILYDETS